MRDDFMSIVSHEVRPLNGLILETQLRKLHLARGNGGVQAPTSCRPWSSATSARSTA